MVIHPLSAYHVHASKLDEHSYLFNEPGNIVKILFE